jgi:hypothetical protein
MQLLPTLPITTAITAQIGPTVSFNAPPQNLTIQANFNYGSGGTSADVYVQTSVDNGATWSDIANFHFLLASARKTFNLSCRTPQTTQGSPSDGALAANTAVDGALGPIFRTKTTTVGTYAGGTTLRVDIAADQISGSPA